MDRLGTDILGPLPVTPCGNKYILVVTDYFSKWVEIFPVPDQTAITCDSIAELCRLLEVRKTRTSGGNPCCNGLTEWFNRTLVRMIKAYIKDEQTDWDRCLGCLAGAYRATVQESTGFTPNLVMMGREVRLPAEVMLGLPEEIQSYISYVEHLRKCMRHAHHICAEHNGRETDRQQVAYDANVHLQKYKPGDMCGLALK